MGEYSAVRRELGVHKCSTQLITFHMDNIPVQVKRVGTTRSYLIMALREVQLVWERCKNLKQTLKGAIHWHTLESIKW